MRFHVKFGPSVLSISLLQLDYYTTQGKQWAIARPLLPFHAVVATYSSGCIPHTVLVLVKFQLSFPSHLGISLF